MDKLIHFPDSKLPALEKLLKLADVSQKDIEEAVKAWEEHPPDEKFKLILQADADNGS